MAWTSTLISKTNTLDKWTFNVSYTDGVSVVNEALEVINPDETFLSRATDEKIKRLESTDEINAATPIGPIEPMPPPIPPIEITKTQKQFIADVVQLRRMLKAVELGLLFTENDAKVSELRGKISTQLQADFTLLDFVDL
jgi:hypothetical protein